MGALGHDGAEVSLPAKFILWRQGISFICFVAVENVWLGTQIFKRSWIITFTLTMEC